MIRNRRVESTGVVDSNGNSTVTVTALAGPSWEVKQIGVTCTSSDPLPSCATYIGFGPSGIFISSTLLGDSDTDSSPNVTLRTGDSISAVWAGASPGAQTRLTIIYDEVGY